MIHSVMKSAIGLDTFMKSKVEQFFKKLDFLRNLLSSRGLGDEKIELDLEDENHIEDDTIECVVRTMVRFMSCCLLYISNCTTANLPDHYFVARSELPKYVVYFDRKELLDTCLEECKKNQKAFNLVSDFINESFSKVDSVKPVICTSHVAEQSSPVDTQQVSPSSDKTAAPLADNLTSMPSEAINMPQSTSPKKVLESKFWKKIPPFEHVQSKENISIDSLFSEDAFNEIPNTDQVLNLSSLRQLSHFLYKNQNNVQKERTYSDYSILKQGTTQKKDVKSFFQNSKLKKRHLLLVTGGKSKFKLLLFKADGLNEEVFHNEMKQIEEMELSNLCYLTINEQTKKGVSTFQNNTLTIADNTEKKKWLFEFSTEHERDEWLYTLKYCLLLC